MKKISEDPTPDTGISVPALGSPNSIPQTFWSSMLKNGPKMFAVGAGGALLTKLLSDLRRNKEDADDNKKRLTGAANVIDVPVPKTAAEGDSWYSGITNFLDDRFLAHPKALLGLASSPDGGGQERENPATIPAAITSHVVPAVLGYYLTDKYFKGRRQGELKSEVEKAKKDYSQLILQDVRSRAPKMASAEMAVDSIVDAMPPLEDDGTQKIAFGSIAEKFDKYMLGIPFTLSLLAGYMGHKNSLQRERELDHFYEERAKEEPRPPTRVRLIADDGGVPPGPPEEEGQEKRAWAGQALLGLKLSEMFSNSHKLPEGPKEVKLKEETDRPERPEVEHIDDNTLRLETPASSFVIEASDPAGMKYLRDNEAALVSALSEGDSE